MKEFRSQAEFRRWLERNGERDKELVLRFFKAGTGRGGITYKQAVDEALCFGWIDGVRRSVDEASFSVRFTPRKAKSLWSAVNRRRYAELLAEGRVTPAGERAFASGIPSSYSFESPPRELDPASLRKLRANAGAWAHWQREAPWYRRTATHWILAAKKPETRERRLSILIESSAAGLRVPPLRRKNQ